MGDRSRVARRRTSRPGANGSAEPELDDSEDFGADARTERRALGPTTARGGRTAMPSSARRRFSSGTVISRKWKIEAASAAWAWPPAGPSSSAAGEALGRAAAARRDHRDGDGVGHRAHQREVVALARAVAVHAREQDLAGAGLGDEARPLDRVAARSRLRPPCVKTSQAPPSPTRFASIATTRFAEPITAAARATRSGSSIAAVMIETLSAPAFRRSRTSSRVRTPPPTVSGMKTDLGRARHDVEQDAALLVARGDVEEGDLVGALLVVDGARPRPGRRRRRGRRSFTPFTTRPRSTSRQGMMRFRSTPRSPARGRGRPRRCRARGPR